MLPFLPLMLLIPLTSELDHIALTLVDAFLNCSECICETFSTSYSETLNSRRRLGCYTLCYALLSVVRLGRCNVDATVDDSAIVVGH
jgi:hypothetical protein